LLAAVRPGGMPWPPVPEGSTASLAKMPMEIKAPLFQPPWLQGGLPSMLPQMLNADMWPPLAEGSTASLEQMLMQMSASPCEQPLLQGGLPCLAAQMLSDGLRNTSGGVEQFVPPSMEPGKHPASKRSSNQKGKTKVAGKDFSQFDILPDMILSGKDSRTTVMVRNLAGPSARKDFLKLLDDIGLSDRYTFFYMPCREHSNELAGFAFLNLIAPHDVNVLHSMATNKVWRKAHNDKPAKALAVSYARYQGHEELVQHFRSSAVLYENDPEKRPIFRPNAGQDYDEYADCHPAFAPSRTSQQSVDGKDPNLSPNAYNVMYKATV
jgi:hypothetical protein